MRRDSCRSVPRMNSGCEVWLNGENIANNAARTFYSSILRLGAYEPGETVRFRFAGSSAHLFDRETGKNLEW